jgi:hypothetical protein
VSAGALRLSDGEMGFDYQPEGRLNLVSLNRRWR